MSTIFEKSKIAWSLYAILDKEFNQNRSIAYLTEEVISGGAGIVQLRDKISSAKDFFAEALKAKEVTNQYNIPLIINDRLDIALALDADGVHLGQNDLPFDVARSLIGENKILGVSVHNLEEFNFSLNCKPDYFGVGTIYPTQTKNKLQVMGPKILELLRPKTSLPLVAIGGITAENLEPVFRAGADGVAVISALLKSENVRTSTMEFVRKINHIKHSLSL